MPEPIFLIERHERVASNVVRYHGIASGVPFYVDVFTYKGEHEFEFVSSTPWKVTPASPVVEEAVRAYGLRDSESSD